MGISESGFWLSPFCRPEETDTGPELSRRLQPFQIVCGVRGVCVHRGRGEAPAKLVPQTSGKTRPFSAKGCYQKKNVRQFNVVINHFPNNY